MDFSKTMTKTQSEGLNKMDRRVVLKSLLTAAVMGCTSRAFAGTPISDLIAQSAGADWGDQFDFDAGGRGRINTDDPVLSYTTVSYMQQSISAYSMIVQNGDWNAVPTDQGELKIGMRNPVVVALRQRLAASGDLAREAGFSQSFDTYVDAAVKRFQLRHGLPADGTVNAITYRALNVSASSRLNQLQINLDRITKKTEQTANEHRFVMVNIPAAQVEAVEDGVVVQRHNAVVGKIDRQTPILDSKINQIIFNPYWTVPKSIIRKDIIPLMQRQPNYLTDNNIHLYNSKGEEVLPENVNWHSDEAVRLMFRQDPGKINAMSSTKINFPNQYSVYMHDTPQQSTFNDLMRFDSSGCVRIQNIRDLDQWLLKNTSSWDRSQIEDVIHSRKNTPVNLKDPVPLHFAYITAWATGDGVVKFRDDIYHMDGSVDLAIGSN